MFGTFNNIPSSFVYHVLYIIIAYNWAERWKSGSWDWVQFWGWASNWFAPFRGGHSK